jgi:hypothetical protein
VKVNRRSSSSDITAKFNEENVHSVFKRTVQGLPLLLMLSTDSVAEYLAQTSITVDFGIFNAYPIFLPEYPYSKINLFPLSLIATLTALAVKFSTTRKHCKILT